MSAFPKLIFPPSVIETLRCTLCRSYLSVLPVVWNDDKYICGRCNSNMVRPGNVPLTIYNTLAQSMAFPCTYSSLGCKEKVTTDSVVQHESSCQFREYTCPSIELGSCKFKGTISQLKDHFNDVHKDLLMNWSYFYLPTKHTQTVNYLMILDKEIFLLQCKTNADLKKCWLGMKHIGSGSDSEKYQFNIELKCAQKGNTMGITQQKVNGSADWNFNEDEMVGFEVNSIKAMLNTTNVLCKLQIVEKREKQNTKQETVKKTKSPDAVFLEELECMVCNEYMIAPIFLCQGGHSICSDCKQKLKICPTCRAAIGTTRNYTLEKLSARIQYPCKYEANGCSFIGSSSEIAVHQQECGIVKSACPLKSNLDCNWNGAILKVYEHCQQQHQEHSWIKLKDDLFRDLNSGIAADFHIVKFEEVIFKVCFKHDVFGSVYWSVQQMDLKPGLYKPRYKFIIDFIDQSEMDRKFTVDWLCCPPSSHNDDFENCLKLSRKVLQPFIDEENCLVFNFDINQIS